MNRSVFRRVLMWCQLAAIATLATCPGSIARADTSRSVNPNGLKGKVMAGSQGWFRCPGDAANQGWVHWSFDSAKITPNTLSFEMWPDVSELTPTEKYRAPGFTLPDGSPAELFSSDNERTVLRHFGWMRDYDIDGVWLQHFVVDLPGQPNASRYESRMRVLNHVRRAAAKTGRVWALSYDIAGAQTDTIYNTITTDWKHLVDTGIVSDKRYLHNGHLPVVQIWGYYYKNQSNRMTADLGMRLIQFFKTPGRYRAYFVGGGDWDWRRNPEADWQKMVAAMDAYVPWNIGNYSIDKGTGIKSASMGTWEEDRKLCDARGVLWIPSIYPGFAWDNLMRQEPGKSVIPRRKGAFLREQFRRLGAMGQSSIYIAMFDEVDEGTAIFKVSSNPPVQAHFQGYEGLPSDAYLSIVKEERAALKRKPSGAGL